MLVEVCVGTQQAPLQLWRLQESSLDSSPNLSNEIASEHFSCDNSTFSCYAQDESKAKLPDMLKCFTLEELKNLGRMLKLEVSHGLTTVSICLSGSIVMTYGRRELHIEALLALACIQTTLGSYSSARPHFTYQRPKLPRVVQCICLFPTTINDLYTPTLRLFSLPTLTTTYTHNHRFQTGKVSLWCQCFTSVLTTTHSTKLAFHTSSMPFLAASLSW